MQSNLANLTNRALIWPTLIALSLSLSACGTPVKKIEVATAPLERVPLNLPNVDKIKLDDVSWVLITPDNAEKVWADLEKKKYDIVLFGLTDKGYENLSVNLAKIKQMVLQQKAVIAAYKNYYEKQSVEIEKQQEKLEEVKKEAAKKNKLADEENNKSLTDKLGKGITNIFK